MKTSLIQRSDGLYLQSLTASLRHSALETPNAYLHCTAVWTSSRLYAAHMAPPVVDTVMKTLTTTIPVQDITTDTQRLRPTSFHIVDL